MSAHQSARAYTLADIDAMREALLRRAIARDVPHGVIVHYVGVSETEWKRKTYGDAVERELQTALVGNVEPGALIASCPAFWKPEEEAAQ